MNYKLINLKSDIKDIKKSMGSEIQDIKGEVSAIREDNRQIIELIKTLNTYNRNFFENVGSTNWIKKYDLNL